MGGIVMWVCGKGGRITGAGMCGKAERAFLSDDDF